MAHWTATANLNMGEVQNLTSATVAQMAQLRTQIDNWANINPDARQAFPFGRFRDHGVSAVTSNASVVKVEYGDNPG